MATLGLKLCRDDINDEGDFLYALPRLHMPNASASRFQFIAHALRADGPFRPVVSASMSATGVSGVALSGPSYLVRYPRESDSKFARRNEVAFFASPLSRACARFVGYMSMRPPSREMANDVFQRVADDVDGKGNNIDVFMHQFAVDAKARGSMLLLVDMPAVLSASRAQQIEDRTLPFWSSIRPEDVIDYELGDDGKFQFCEFGGTFTKPGGGTVACTWHFDRTEWSARDTKAKLAQGVHSLGECPVLIFTEGGDFPLFGPFAAIADLGKRLFNADSELDEILRAQTFSLLTMQVPEQSTDAQKIAAAQVAGETIGTSNLMVHGGSTPAFIAPPDGPARIYLDRIAGLRAEIDEVGLNVATVNQQESGIAMQMRFQAINGQLSKFSSRMEDLERRAWDLCRRWLQMTMAPTTTWPRDFNIAEVQTELTILADMQAAGMPSAVIAEQQKRVVSLQFPGLEQTHVDELTQAIDEALLQPKSTGNVIPLRADPNAPVRDAIVKALGNG